MTGRLRTYDLRLWVTADPAWPALERFLVELRELAEPHPGVEPRWVAEKRRRDGGPSVRVHAPPRELDDPNLIDDAGDAPEGRGTP